MEYKFPELTIKKKINNKTTLIIVTSPIPTHPNTDIVDEAIQSALDLDYQFHEIIISYDCPKKKNNNYEKYKLKMKEKYPKFKHLEMKEHGHFIGSFYNALCHTKTEYFMMLQHDIKLVGPLLPIDKLLKLKLNWNILATHHMKDGLKKTHWYPIIQKKNKYVEKTWGWSERIFLSKRDFFLKQIKQCYESGRTINFMDTIFHKEFNKLFKKTEKIKKFTDINPSKEQMKIYNQYWNEWKCFNIKSEYGYHEHLHGRTKKQRTKKQNKKTKKKGQMEGWSSPPPVRRMDVPGAMLVTDPDGLDGYDGALRQFLDERELSEERSKRGMKSPGKRERFQKEREMSMLEDRDDLFQELFKTQPNKMNSRFKKGEMEEMMKEFEVEDMERANVENDTKIESMQDAIDKLRAAKKPDTKRRKARRKIKRKTKRKTRRNTNKSIENTRKKKDKCCKCHYVRTPNDKRGKLRKVRGSWGHCSYDMGNCCKDKKTIQK